MIRQIGLRNVRLFSNPGYTFDLPALTIFCGTNSTGKSTVLKSFLLLRQSQGLYEAYGINPGMLRFTGAQVDLGNYQSFVTDRLPRRRVELSLSVQDRMPKHIASALAEKKKHVPEYRDRSQSTEYTLKTTFTFKAHNIATETDKAGHISTVTPQGILHRADFALFLEEVQIASWSVRKVPSSKGDVSYRLNLPASEVCKWDKDFLELLQNTDSEADNFSVPTELEGILPAHVLYSKKGVPRARRERVRLPSHIRGTLFEFASTLRHIQYLAPLRAAAKRYYLANYDVTPDLDPRGDFLPYILGGFWEEPEVIDIAPKRMTPKILTLTRALDGWLYYLRTGTTYNKNSARSELGVSTTKGTLVEIELKALRGHLKHSIVDSGFGYSQVLPILVRGLMAPIGSTIVIEQPEVHLNPALQVRLADFLISLVRAGKQVIIETHSEHIVNAVRVRTAEENSGFLSSNSRIYFLDVAGGKPVIHDLSIMPDGTVPQWPYSFFGEAFEMTGNLLRAQKAHRKH